MKHILIILLLLIELAGQSATYYIKVGGNDSFTGLSDAQAWSFTKLATFNPSPSDQILLKKGNTFYGTLMVRSSGSSGNPITFGAYGTGANPIITGFTDVTAWTNEGGGIYSKVITSESATNMVTVDGVQYALGRTPNYPNWLSYESCSTNVSITDIGLGTSTNWTGAEAVIKKNGFNIDRCLITDHTGDVLTYTNLGGTGNGTAGYGYFIQNDLRTLDQFGEWYHDYSGSGKFYMYFGAVNPTTKTVKVATKNRVIANTSGYDYITIDGINANGSILSTVDFLSATNYCTVKNCTVSFSGLDGVRINGSNGLIDNNTVSYCNVGGIAIGASGTTANTITNNSVSNCNMLDGQKNKNTVGFSFPCGILSAYWESIIQYNRIENVGYNGMHVGGINQLVKNNYITNAVARLTDGGGIYTNGTTTNFIIEENIITDLVGYIGGTPLTSSSCEGIYLDEYCNGLTVQNNTVSGCSASGIKLHKSYSNSILNNTCFNNSKYQINFLNTQAAEDNLHDNTVTGNKFICKDATQYALRFYNPYNSVAMGTYNNNYYARPIDDTDNFTTYLAGTTATKTLPQWKTFSSQDAASLGSPQSITDVNDLQLYANNTKLASTVTLTQPMIDVIGTKYSVSTTLQPFTSLVLMPQTAYYISSSGNDLDDGLSPSTAWQTLTRVNAKTKTAGDNFLFKRGDVFYGNLTVSQSGSAGLPITFGAYGIGANPVITGFTDVTAWTNLGGNIWESTNPVSSLTTCNMVVINDINTPMGRFPKSGYYYFQSHSDNYHITSSDLDGTYDGISIADLTGAELAFNNTTYSTKRCPITSQSGTTITFTQPESFSTIQNGLKFIIQNDIRCCTQQNDWYYNPSTKKLRIYSTSQPTNVKVSSVDDLITNEYRDYITFENIKFTGSNNSAFYLGAGDYSVIRNCEFDKHGTEAIQGVFWDTATGLTVENCTFTDINNVAIAVCKFFTSAIIRNNSINNAGMIYGATAKLVFGITDAGIAKGIAALGSGTTIEDNTITNIGYIGISYLGNNVTVQRNFIKDYCKNYSDGGAIYTWNGSNTTYSGTKVSKNTVIGDDYLNLAFNDQQPMRAGIYLDVYSNGIEISDNSIANCDIGIFLGGNHNITVLNNTVYNSACCLRLYNNTASSYTNTTISGNKFIAKTANQLCLHTDPAETYKTVITSNNNYFARPIAQGKVIEGYERTPVFTGLSQTLAEWQTYSGQDANSKGGYKVIPNTAYFQFIYNETSIAKTFTFDDSYADIQGNGKGASITLQPNTSLVLVKQDWLKHNGKYIRYNGNWLKY